MQTLEQVAAAHNASRILLDQQVSRKARRIWAQADRSYLEASWDALAPLITAEVLAGQISAAEQSAAYLDAVSLTQGHDAPKAKINPRAFSGVMLDGREVGPALYGGVTTTKQRIAQGWPLEMAFQSGATFLGLIAKAAVQDMGRQSDGTLAVGRHYQLYVRVVSAGACSRCAILAGKSSYRVAFKRHPACRCTAAPVGNDEAIPEGMFAGPHDYFESLPAAEQDRIFTKSGAEAIRQGADPAKVVNARRGAYGIGYSGHQNAPSVGPNRLEKLTIGKRADGSPLQVYATSEGTSYRSSWARQQIDVDGNYAKGAGDRYRKTTMVRLMPEQIAIMAGGDAARWRELLAKYGYLA
jgi:hypothetical protein